MSGKRDGQYRTSHLLHIILVVLTGGLWLIPYAAVAIGNAMGRRRLATKVA
jgi:hypothetical protein